MHAAVQPSRPSGTCVSAPLEGADLEVDGAGRGGATDGNGRLVRPVLRVATAADREAIYRIRHEVYAREMGQHHVNEAGRLTDALDDFNTYLVICRGSELAAFVSLTPPGGRSYSMDKYFRREQLPFPYDEGLYEIRLLTVLPAARRGLFSLALMYAAFRWAEARGGTRLMAIGRREIRGMHVRVGIRPIPGLTTQAGAVVYDALQATMQDIHDTFADIRPFLERIRAELDWQLGVPYDTPAPCYHGGRFFEAVGEEFESLDRLGDVISADVLDAWFPPSPKVIEMLRRHLPRLLQTSPPTGCEGLVRAIARARGVPAGCILPGAGSSDLIFRALPHWLGRGSRALILDPTYGEYAHVLERVIGCRVDRLVLKREADYRLDPGALAAGLAAGYDLVVLVNPNSPTGQYAARVELERVLRGTPPGTRVWVDETYIDYAGGEESLERFAAGSEQVVVCKSMSKTYALSGARVAYLCAGRHQLESLRSITPPWVVGLPSQVAAVAALGDPEYYAARYRETHALREALKAAMAPLGWEILAGATNFLLCWLAPDDPEAPGLIDRCRERGLFLRDTSNMGSDLGGRVLRVAVKDGSTNRRMVEILRSVVGR